MDTTEVRLGRADDIVEGELSGYEIGEHYVLVTRVEGALHALDDVCVHAGCLLSGGWLEGREVVCPCHEYRFDAETGRNVTVPRLCGDQPVLPVRVDDDGMVVVKLGRPST